MHQVSVTASWESHHSFEFETEEEADEFRSKVSAGGEEGLDAIVENGDVTSQIAELVGWDAS